MTGQIEVDLHHRHEAEREHQVVHVGDHGAERELPFEAEPEIDQDRADRHDDADRAVGQELARDARADHLDAAVFDLVAERALDLLDRGLLRVLAAGLLRDADQHVGRPAELLQLHLAEAERRRASRASCARSAGPDLACTSISVPPTKSMPKLRPWIEEQHDRQDRQQRRDRKADAPEAHEIELGVVRDDPQQRHGAMKAAQFVRVRKSAARCGRAPAHPARHDQARQRERGEHRGDDADAERHGEAAHRPGADEEQHRGGDEGGDVGVQDGGERAGEARRRSPRSRVRPARTSSRMRS